MTDRRPRRTNRRNFLQAAVTTAAVGWSWPGAARSASGAAAPNETIRVGVIGCGVRGKYLIGNLPPAAKVTAICDCSATRLARVLEPAGEFAPVLQRFRERDALGVSLHQDYRRMLDREALDAVIIATPDHHHVLAAMLAMQAGLDVYVEKPLTLTISEGRRLAEMVQRTGRVLQVGSQQRSMEINRWGCEFIRRGGLGKISHVVLPCYPGPLSMEFAQAEPPPAGLNWEMFLGPARDRPYSPRLWIKEEFEVDGLLWRGWDLDRDYSGHLMTNWGAHSIDMVQLALGRDDSGPVSIAAGRPGVIDALGEAFSKKTPMPLSADERRFWPVVMTYADGVRLSFTGGPEATYFFGERGRLMMKRNHIETDPPELLIEAPDPSVAEKWIGGGHVARPHLENWLDCIRSRQTPIAPVEAGHRTATICHLANLSRELNRPLKWDPHREQFVEDEAANLLLDRPRRRGFALPTG